MKIVAALFAAALLLAGCGGSDSEGSADPTSATSTPAAEPTDGAGAEPTADAATIDPGTVLGIVIQGGKVIPQGQRSEVKVGEKITLNIRSDVDEEIHVHSEPEHTYEIEPGEVLTESFTIDTPGQVAIEAHHLGVTIAQLVVRP